jgi:hypothetical protein
MKTIVLLFFLVPLLSIAQNRIVKEIRITHTAEDLYLSYIAPMGCDENQKHGPIIIADSLEIAKIYCLLLESEECLECSFEPDVRFKAEFVFDNKSFFLCFSDPKDIMSYSGKLYKYNTPLCSLIIDNITKTGVKLPNPVGLPDSKSNKSNYK